MMFDTRKLYIRRRGCLLLQHLSTAQTNWCRKKNLLCQGVAKKSTNKRGKKLFHQKTSSVEVNVQHSAY